MVSFSENSTKTKVVAIIASALFLSAMVAYFSLSSESARRSIENEAVKSARESRERIDREKAEMDKFYAEKLASEVSASGLTADDDMIRIQEIRRVLWTGALARFGNPKVVEWQVLDVSPKTIRGKGEQYALDFTFDVKDFLPMYVDDAYREWKLRAYFKKADGMKVYFDGNTQDYGVASVYIGTEYAKNFISKVNSRIQFYKMGDLKTAFDWTVAFWIENPEWRSYHTEEKFPYEFEVPVKSVR